MRAPRMMFVATAVACTLAAVRVDAGKSSLGNVVFSASTRPAGCQPTKEDSSSLHAAVLETTLLAKPSGQEKQLFRCGKQDIAVYWYDYASAEKAVENAPFMGARLWGAAGPSAHHHDELMIKGGVIAVLSPTPGPLGVALVRLGFKPFRLAPRPDSGPIDVTQTQLDTMRSRINCETHRYYCDALRKFARGKRPTFPVKVTALAGSSLVSGPTFPGKKPVAAEEASYLLASKVGAKYGTVKPTNPEERQQVATFLSAVRAGKPVAASNPIMAYVQSLAKASALRKTRVQGSSLYYQGKNHVFVRQVGRDVIVVEHDNNAFFVGVFRQP